MSGDANAAAGVGEALAEPAADAGLGGARPTSMAGDANATAGVGETLAEPAADAGLGGARPTSMAGDANAAEGVGEVRGRGQRPGEEGSAVAEYALVSALVVLFFLAAFQLGFALYVRNTLIAHAAEGARYGARADSSPGAGADRASSLIRTSLSGRYARNVSAVRTSTSAGVAVVQVRVSAPLPVVGPWGPQGELVVRGRAYAEDQ